MGVAEDPSKIRTDKLVTKIHTKSSELRREIESCHAERALFKDDALKVQVRVQILICNQTNNVTNKLANEQSNIQTNKQANEQSNKQTNEQTNESSSKRHGTYTMSFSRTKC